MFKDLPEGETHSFLDPDWVSDCCGAKMKQVAGFYDGRERGRFSFLLCEHCEKPCRSKQLHDVKITILKK
jgi:hypothetical protein